MKKKQLKGGISDKKTIEQVAKEQNVDISFAKEQLEKGITVEREHTDNDEIAKEIALDHLAESINYYIELEKMEEKLKSGDRENENLTEKIKSKIEERIKGAQLSKELKDTNIVEYTRKYKAAYDIITSADLDNIEKDSITAYKLIEKNKIWTKYNIEQQKEMGYPSGIVYLKIKLREALGSKPIDNKIARKIYVDAIEELRTDIDNITDLNDFAGYLYKFYKKHGKIATRELYLPKNRSRYSYLSDDYVHSKTFKDIFGPKFENFLKLYSDSAKQIFVEANLYNSFTEGQRNQIIQKEKEKYKKQIDHYQSLIETIKSANDNETLERIERQEYIGLKSSGTIEDKKQDIISTLKKRAVNYQERYNAPILNKIYTVREEDWSWAQKDQKTEITGEKEQAANQTILEKYGIDIKKNAPTPLEYIKRTKGLPIPEINIENIQKYFGYKDVVFGNYVSNKEGKEHVRHFLGAMLDLAELLDIDIKQINNLGGLSIAIGAIGCGPFSKALACYYPDRKVINVTKKRGDGTLAHEWSHYLDNVLADGNEKTNSPKFATDLKLIYKNNQSIKQKVQDIINYFMLGEKKTVTMKFNRFIGKKYPKYSVYSDTIESSIEKVQTRYQMYKDYYKTKNTKDIYNYYRYIATKFNVDNIEVPLEIHTSNFYYISTLYDETGKVYFGKKEEMFARAFESYIEYKLEKLGRHSNYLVSIVNNLGLIALLIPQNQWPYPYGKEREDLAKLYDKLIEAIKTEYNINSFRWHEDIRQDEYIDFKDEDKTDKVDAGIIIKNETKNKDQLITYSDFYEQDISNLENYQLPEKAIGFFNIKDTRFYGKDNVRILGRIDLNSKDGKYKVSIRETKYKPEYGPGFDISANEIDTRSEQERINTPITTNLFDSPFKTAKNYNEIDNILLEVINIINKQMANVEMKSQNKETEPQKEIPTKPKPPGKEILIDRMELLIEMITDAKGEEKAILKERYGLLKEMLTDLN